MINGVKGLAIARANSYWNYPILIVLVAVSYLTIAYKRLIDFCSIEKARIYIASLFVLDIVYFSVLHSKGEINPFIKLIALVKIVVLIILLATKSRANVITK